MSGFGRGWNFVGRLGCCQHQVLCQAHANVQDGVITFALSTIPLSVRARVTAHWSDLPLLVLLPFAFTTTASTLLELLHARAPDLWGSVMSTKSCRSHSRLPSPDQTSCDREVVDTVLVFKSEQNPHDTLPGRILGSFVILAFNATGLFQVVELVPAAGRKT